MIIELATYYYTAIAIACATAMIQDLEWPTLEE